MLLLVVKYNCFTVKHNRNLIGTLSQCYTLQTEKPTMRAIEIAIAEKAYLLQEAVANVVSLLQYNVALRVPVLTELLEWLQHATTRPDICIVNITEPDSLLGISLLKKSYPSLAIIGYSHDERNIIVRKILSHVDCYLHAKDSVAALNQAIVKSCLRYY